MDLLGYGVQKGLTAYVADTTNAFAEGPPLIHPLYMTIDNANQKWWKYHLKHPLILLDHIGVRVTNCHPGTPRVSYIVGKIYCLNLDNEQI
jgi:hypothetical protein